MIIKLIFLFLVTISLTLSSELLIQEDFDYIESIVVDNISIFYYSSNASSTLIVSMMESMASILLVRYPNLLFFKCDGDLNINKIMFEDAGFEYNKVYMFFQINNEIELYGQDIITSENIIKHINSMHSEIKNENAVSIFTSMDEYNKMKQDKPIFIKFDIDNCSPCDALTKPFLRYANIYSDKNIQFLSINCSKEETKALCKDVNKLGFPFMGYHSSKEVKYLTSTDRTFVGVDAFLQPLLTSEAN